MISSILIANRGEIACRIIATAKKMGIRTIAIASDPDKQARHALMADAVAYIGGDSPATSYLDQAKILAAAKSHAAEAIHPGYGFLSENPEFVEAVAKAGLIFIGPGAEAIRAMGLKDKAKQLMADAGVPVVPGYNGAEQAEDMLYAEACKIGFPVMIKARAGGGGKGMRRVEAEADFIEALKSTRREAAASFGDDHVLIEKYISRPRHIEVQIFADHHGNLVHLFERDCSLQRRHQKVIEEAPAPDMTPETRAAMTKAAIKVAQAIGYRGAGTVEFIVDGRDGLRPDGFWFMEMNTRLQVEHPVTEMITGFDLVEWQIKIASGAPLPVRQEEIKINGHALEARLYAEDASAGFLPAPGPVYQVSFPQNIRIDHGIGSSDTISAYYDPMIAKIITHQPNRSAAFSALQRGLCETHILGTITNLRFLAVLASHPDVAAMQIDTSWIDRHLDSLNASMSANDFDLDLMALAHLCADGGIGEGQGWRLWGQASYRLSFYFAETLIERQVFYLSEKKLRITGGKADQMIDITYLDDSALSIQIDGRAFSLKWIDYHGQISIDLGYANFRITRKDATDVANDQAGGDSITAPMTGVVTVLECAVGQEVAKGDVLIRMEAMKMEHALTAPCDGMVRVIYSAVGETANDGMVLITLEPKA
ncbi:MAG: acetyl/propionyl/methylcrotonyl-CoA carboxylase subunit alpha [Candidatus Puniceispirillaceae bacterium]